ncbi:unnamed protein product [Cuscuta campestris]|uniref:Uncharacterized protein n=1 Tax=Cuscuta campestris TaxID=132261 RepID=A0A484KBG2_9ASTE|nr:unnamed protein product [Cuscuta campestris]
MEEVTNEQSSASAGAKRSSARLLRYPLRSAGKAKVEKPQSAGSSNLHAPRRGKAAPSVSKSVSVLDLNNGCKDKPAKPPRRMSIPSKSTASPASSVQVGNITPISEAVRSKRSNTRSNEGRSDTPLSDVSRSLTRRKFSVLSSASYWLTQIKLSESAAKHSISIGLFKLGFEAGCEPLQRMRDELKAYAQRHNLVEVGEEPVKQLFECYNILPDFEQLQVSETCSHVPEEGTQSVDDEIHSSSPVVGSEKLGTPKPTPSTKEPSEEQAKNELRLKSDAPSTKKQPMPTKKEPGVVNGRNNVQKKNQKPIKKKEAIKDEVKLQGKKTVNEEEPIEVPAPVKVHEENKENTDSLQAEEIGCLDE